ncbi:hypothetical protein ACVWWJ_002700 [Luteibacter sp. HA06]
MQSFAGAKQGGLGRPVLLGAQACRAVDDVGNLDAGGLSGGDRPEENLRGADGISAWTRCRTHH